jgi:hypothetical protein
MKRKLKSTAAKTSCLTRKWDATTASHRTGARSSERKKRAAARRRPDRRQAATAADRCRPRRRQTSSAKRPTSQVRQGPSRQGKAETRQASSARRVAATGQRHRLEAMHVVGPHARRTSAHRAAMARDPLSDVAPRHEELLLVRIIVGRERRDVGPPLGSYQHEPLMPHPRSSNGVADEDEVALSHTVCRERVRRSGGRHHRTAVRRARISRAC